MGAANPEVVLALDGHGTLTEMPPAGGTTSTRNPALLFLLQAWARTSGDRIVRTPSARRSAMAFRPSARPCSAGGTPEPADRAFPGLILDPTEIWRV